MSSLAPKPVDGPQKIVQGVWGAKLVWGSSSRSDGETTKLNEGDEECYICFEAAIDVNFVPCKHGACTTCVGQLRAAAIFSVRLTALMIDIVHHCIGAALRIDGILKPSEQLATLVLLLRSPMQASSVHTVDSL